MARVSLVKNGLTRGRPPANGGGHAPPDRQDTQAPGTPEPGTQAPGTQAPGTQAQPPPAGATTSGFLTCGPLTPAAPGHGSASESPGPGAGETSVGAATVTGTARFAYGPTARHGPGPGEAQDGRAGGAGGGDAPPSASTRFALGDGPFPSGATGLIGAIDRAPDPSAAAFDLLHRRLHTSLTRQLFLLTGDLEQAERAVERAFHLAWEQWPLIAVDPDPESWLRSAAFDCACSPWQRFLPWSGRPSDPAARGAEPRPASRPEPRPGSREQHRSLLGALAELTAPQRYTVLLCDALGLRLPEAAAETQATTLATAERLDRAHTALAGTVPELAGLDPYGDGLPERLGRLLREAAGEVAVRPRRPADVRADGEKHGVRLVMGTGALVAALVLGMLVSLFPDADRFTTRPPDPPRPTVAP